MPRRPPKKPGQQAPRQPQDIVQVNLKIREQERRQLVAEAEKNRVSLNAEMASRIMSTFEQRRALTALHVIEEIETGLKPMLDGFAKLNRQAELVRATGKLIERTQRLIATKVIDGPEADATKADVARIQTIIKAIEVEWVQRLHGTAEA